MNNHEICKNCAFWQPDTSKSGSIGWCWMNPPQILVRKSPSYDGSTRENIKTVRPLTGYKHFCASWKDGKEDTRRHQL